jgi:arylsulfatase A-like enzyme
MISSAHVIGRTVDESHLPYVAQAAPPDRPNVVMIVLDDVGFGQLGAFGSDIETPHIDRLAANGLRYNRFHVTALCSPSRACFLTGRNPHSVGMGYVPDRPLRAPGYTGRIPKSAATLAHHLRDDGYSTLAVGKWHLTPYPDRTASGPFDWWPLGQGFERFYGFLHADTNQWTPNLVADNHFVEPPRTPDEGYHLTEDLVDNAIRQVVDQQQATPDKPFFLYFATGAMHAPHQVPPEWVERYRGRFDDGWERWRERTFARQLQSGVVPSGTTLTERPPWVQTWDDLPPEERRLYARMHEIFAGFFSHTDHHIGRLIASLEERGVLDNTIIMLCSDNGASAEGGPVGSINEHRFPLNMDSLTDNLAHIDELGGFRHYNHYAWGWAWAGNTPFKLWKRYTWLGGTRVPLVVHWPRGIQARGEVRSQFAHAIDLAPTALDLCGVTPAQEMYGVAQQSFDGVSLRSTLADENSPESRPLQYFEMVGSRSIYYQGWKANTDRVASILPEEGLLQGSRQLETDRWSLFNLAEDFSEAHDLADEQPELVRKLESLWWAEAGRNQVLPMGDWMKPTSGHSQRLAAPAPHMPGTHVVLRPGGGHVAAEAVPSLAQGGQVLVEVDVPDGDVEGVLCAQGDWTGGWALYVREGVLAYVLNAASREVHVRADEKLPVGRHAVGVRYLPNDHRGGMIELSLDGRSIGSGDLPMSPSFGGMQADGSGLLLGQDAGFPVCDDYRPPFPWTGTLHTVTFDVATAPHQEEPDTEIVLRRD